MKIQPKTQKEAMDLVYNILIQGDGRYNNFENERILAGFLLNNTISLEEKEIPQIKEPEPLELVKIGRIQPAAKYIVKSILKEQGFSDFEIFFERRFLGSQTDVFAENENKIIIGECYSCRINKIFDYLSEADEVWIITRGLPPWEKIPYLKEKMQFFIFKKGKNWNQILEFRKKQIQDLKNIPDLL